jgi:hypothetical protein
MQFNQTPLDGNDFAITATGEIVEGDTDRASALIQNLVAATPTARIQAFALDSPGSQIDEAKKLAALIRRLRAGVMVLPGAQCDSACFLLFASGVPKIIALDALIGVQSISIEGLSAMAATTLMARDAAEHDVPLHAANT